MSNRLKTIAYMLAMFCLPVVTCLAETTSGESAPDEREVRIDFDTDVRPILASKCLKCHGPGDPEAGLDLSHREKTFEMRAVVPSHPEQSELISRIQSTEAEHRMPPTGERLSPEQIAVLTRWIKSGAEWPVHWAYQPVTEPQLPELSDPALRDWCRSPIDRFIAAGLATLQLTPSPQADRATLIRRITFDLHGVPPTPEEIDSFVQDTSSGAWERVIDRLLADPRYGERWARHWMDLVHYAESHGHDQDRNREYAWPYRDYLIRSFNADLPYGEFVEDQIAGDVLRPQNPGSIEATGFLAAGPWDESSLMSINEDSIDRQVARYIDRDDIITNVMSTFASTSVHCARCHDHKFDPIPQSDYYRLQAVFSSTDKANRPYDPDAAVAARRADLSERMQQLNDLFRDHPNQAVTPELCAELEELKAQHPAWRTKWESLRMEVVRSQSGTTFKMLEDGSALAEGANPEKEIVYIEARGSLKQITALRIEVLPDPSFPMQGPGRAGNGNLTINEIRISQVLDPALRLVQEFAVVSPSADFNQTGWEIPAALDGNPNTGWGIFPEVGKPHEAILPLQLPMTSADERIVRVELHQIFGGQHVTGRFRLSATDASVEGLGSIHSVPSEIRGLLAHEISALTPEQLARLGFLYQQWKLQQQIDALPPMQYVYAGTNQFAESGSFRPAKEPRPIHVLHRGMISEPREEVFAGSLGCISVLSAEFGTDSTQPDGERRAALARWLSDRRNPLVWRSIANRVWQYHFGTGIVDTPNDFGQMGSAPSHPQLLDWMASQLLLNEGSIKSLHREILKSAVYQQVSTSRPEAELKDGSNRMLWRMNRRRLDAESYRDALLVISGTIDPRMGGPSAKQFNQTLVGTDKPNADYAGFNIDDPANFRRSVYRFIFRTLPDPFMEAMDCPDASQLTPQRTVSLSAIQAFATLNDKFVIRQSELLANSLQTQTDDPDQQLRIVYRRLFGRLPAADELQSVKDYMSRFGLANACRFLFNTNEFLFVE